MHTGRTEGRGEARKWRKAAALGSRSGRLNANANLLLFYSRVLELVDPQPEPCVASDYLNTRQLCVFREEKKT